MSYPTEVVTRANEITSARRQAAEQEQRARHREISEKAPDIIKYEAQLAETGLAVLKALTMGGDAQKYIKAQSPIPTFGVLLLCRAPLFYASK